jgi:hypothetical protein
MPLREIASENRFLTLLCFKGVPLDSQTLVKEAMYESKLTLSQQTSISFYNQA